jgi:hypothetical protein
MIGVGQRIKDICFGLEETIEMVYEARNRFGAVDFLVTIMEHYKAKKGFIFLDHILEKEGIKLTMKEVFPFKVETGGNPQPIQNFEYCLRSSVLHLKPQQAINLYQSIPIMADLVYVFGFVRNQYRKFNDFNDENKVEQEKGESILSKIDRILLQS